MLPTPTGGQRNAADALDLLQPMTAIFLDGETPAARLLSLREVATALHVSQLTVYRLLDRRELRAFRVARRLRFHPQDIRAFLEHRKTPAPYGRS